MSEERKNEQVLTGLRDQVSELTREISSVSAAASRRWKITAWVVGILCAAIVIYLGYFYSKLKVAATPEELAKIGVLYYRERQDELQDELTQSLKGLAPEVMQALDEEVGELDVTLAKLRETLAKQLIEMAPKLAEGLQPELEKVKKSLTEDREELVEKLKLEAKTMADKIKPQLEQLKDEIPELTEKYKTTLTDMAPKMADKFQKSAIDYLPRLRDRAMSMTQRELDARKPELVKLIDDAVETLIDQHADNMAKLDGDELTAILVPAFEEAAGPVLDEFSKGVEASIASVKDTLSGLLQKYKTGNLTRKEEIELRYIQLWKTYWNVRMEEPIEPVEPLVF